jgi:hypothetical protein
VVKNKNKFIMFFIFSSIPGFIILYTTLRIKISIIAKIISQRKNTSQRKYEYKGIIFCARVRTVGEMTVFAPD